MVLYEIRRAEYFKVCSELNKQGKLNLKDAPTVSRGNDIVELVLSARYRVLGDHTDLFPNDQTDCRNLNESMNTLHLPLLYGGIRA